MAKRYTDMSNPVSDAIDKFRRGEATWEETLVTLEGDVGESTYPPGGYEDLDDPRNRIRMAENWDYDPHEAVILSPWLNAEQRAEAATAVVTGQARRENAEK